MAKKKKKPYLLAFLLGLLPALGFGQSSDQVQVTLLRNYDVTTAGYTYTAFASSNSAAAVAPMAGVLGPGTEKNCKITTSGSSTTVTALTASTCAPFLGVAVGDLLLFPRVFGALGSAPTEEERVVATRASDDSITVDAAITLDATANATTGGSYTFRYKKLRTGTAATSAWFSVQGFDTFNIQFDVTTINAASVTATLECRVSKYATANTLYTNAFTAIGAASVSVSTKQEECRIGWKLAGDAGAQVVAAYLYGVK